MYWEAPNSVVALNSTKHMRASENSFVLHSFSQSAQIDWSKQGLICSLCNPLFLVFCRQMPKPHLEVHCFHIFISTTHYWKCCILIRYNLIPAADSFSKAWFSFLINDIIQKIPDRLLIRVNYCSTLNVSIFCYTLPYAGVWIHRF